MPANCGENSAIVSEAVVAERAKENGLSCEAVIQKLSQLPLSRATVNTHIRQGRAGLHPRSAQKLTNLSKEDELRILTLVAKATDDLELFSCAEIQGLLQEAIDGTELSARFKHGNVSRQYAHLFRTR
jgi:hypothetical protein